jgi:hypothetical protein
VIERMLAFGGLEPPQLFQSLREIKAFFKELGSRRIEYTHAGRRSFKDDAISRGGSFGRGGATGLAGTDKT